MFNEFKQFLLRGNVIDLAVGVVMGGAFGTVVSALVSDILTPLIETITKIPTYKGLVFGIENGLVFKINESSFALGHLFNSIFSFVLVGAAVFFFVVKPVNLLMHKSKPAPAPAPTTKKCPECLGDIPIAAKRCMHCGELVQK